MLALLGGSYSQTVFFQDGGHHSDHRHLWSIPSGIKALFCYQLIWCCFPQQILHKYTRQLGSELLVWCWWNHATVFVQGVFSLTQSPNFAVLCHISLGLHGTTGVVTWLQLNAALFKIYHNKLWTL